MTLVLTLPTGEYAVTGKQVSFISPCDSHEDLTHIQIQGETYKLVDSVGNPPTHSSFNEGAIVSVILNNETSEAYIQNASSSKYLESLIREALVPYFEESENLENIQNGENIHTMLGKIAKFLSCYLSDGSNTGGSIDYAGINFNTQTLSAGSKATVFKTINPDGSVNLTFGIPRGESGINGQNGKDGNDGESPVITVNKSGKVTTLTVINPNGSTYTTNIYDGADGTNGSSNNNPTLSSVITADKVNGVTTLTISNPDGTSQSVDILDGAKGANGRDGYSPRVTAVKNGNVATLYVSNGDGTSYTVEILDGTATDVSDLTRRVSNLETQVGDISAILDEINGEVI